VVELTRWGRCDDWELEPNEYRFWMDADYAQLVQWLGWSLKLWSIPPVSLEHDVHPPPGSPV
jgi:hypothetical protein